MKPYIQNLASVHPFAKAFNMKSALVPTLIAIVLAAMLFNDAEAVDCRLVLGRVNCDMPGGPGSCNEWCRSFAFSGGACITIPGQCPGKAAGSRGCLCN
ncbi:hypothetical protein AAVH_19038 [Aphelenchoides avenae]|nr:hypothetical protein AAVH_19038 [Aphelenchus avenae]